MARRVAGPLVLTSVLLGLTQAHGEVAPPPQLPLDACDERVNDAPGDGIVDWTARAGTGPNVDDPRGSVDGLDITGVTVRLTQSRVYAFTSLKDLPATMRQTDTAYGYYMWFTSGAKIVRFDHVVANPLHAQAGQAPQGYPLGSVGDTPTGGPTPLNGRGGGVDTTRNVVYVYADRDSLEEQLGGPLADGDRLTGILGKTVLFVGNGAAAAGVTQRPADETEVPAETAVQTVGQDTCFAPSPFATTDMAARYGDRVTLRATLTDETGAPLAGRPVSFAVPGEPAARALTTGTDGAVAVTLTAPVAKSYGFTVTYAGDDFSGPGVARGTLTVKPETIRIAPLKVTRSGSARTVTATLTEDDPRAFAKQPVDWYVNGRKAATVLTDSAGRSVFRGAKAGQKVEARYAGAAGRYAAAKSATVTG